MEYEAVIGLEVHAQLLTKTKMFCRDLADYSGAAPNSHICPVCAGFPGVLPVINEAAVELALRVGLALNCNIAPISRFDRKHYPYPDLPKGYQISQYNLPLATDGYVELESGKRVGIIRVHMEEDTGRLLHRRSPEGEVYTLVDLNRAGVPLLEIVTKPDLRSGTEAREFVSKLRQILRYIDANSGNMEEGALRVDANVSVRPKGETYLGPKVEIKNMNSFRAVERALDYEISRQIQVISKGGAVERETRGWDEAEGVTLPQRTKEMEHDYRYFPEPDLPPLTISSERISRTRELMPELPDERRQRFVSQYDIAESDARVLTSSKEVANYFEAVVEKVPSSVGAKGVANWIVNTLFGILQKDGKDITETNVTPDYLAELLVLLQEGKINTTTARSILEEVHASGKSPRVIVEERGLSVIADSDQITSIVIKVIDNNPQAVADYLKGKKQAIGFLLGQVMKETKGRASPDIVREVLTKELAQRST